MKTYEEIKDEVNEVHSCSDKEAAMLYAEQFKPQWIDVKERLPEYGKKVLCFGHEMAMNPQMGGFYCFICYRMELLKERHNKHLNSQLDENGFKRATVTHWMPLPDGPF